MNERPFAAHGETHPGRVRAGNEDAFLVDDALGLYLVLDGMGGHSAGDVASALARDHIRARIREQVEGAGIAPVGGRSSRRVDSAGGAGMDPVGGRSSRRVDSAGGAGIAPVGGSGARTSAEVLAVAVRSASGAVHGKARQKRELRGMGTTVVGCLRLDARRVVIAHVGDSRAYLVRDGKLIQLTADHTVVAELVARGALRAADAERHPYRSVLSKNLGGRPDAEVDLREVVLEPGDRLLLCSDGLSGFATHQAIEQVVVAAADPARAARDLIELALMGGGGDNVTALVIETERVVEPEAALALRQRSCAAWVAGRADFLAAARAEGVAASPVCALLSPDEAIAIVAGNLHEALAADLRAISAIHVWTYADDLATGWLEQGGAVATIRALFDALGHGVDAVVRTIGAGDAALGVALEIAALRGLVVGETALAAAVGKRLRRVEDELSFVQGDELLLATAASDVALPPARSPGGPAISSELALALAAARAGATRALARPGVPPMAAACLAAAHELAAQAGGRRPARTIARELFGGRPLTEAGLEPLLEALDRGRRAHLKAARAEVADGGTRAAVVARIAAAHRGLSLAIAELASETAGDIDAGRRDLATEAAALRAELGRGEVELARLERALRAATTHDGIEPVEVGR